jgi:hypothetical protein
MRLPFLICLLVLLSFNLSSQNFTKINEQDIFDITTAKKGDFEIVFNSTSTLDRLIPLTTLRAKAVFKIGKEVLIHLIGTGEVYKVLEEKDKDGRHSVIRIDSTKFGGYNFRSLSFYYDSSIYNMGGYGLWHYNGLLRKYSFEQSEWNVEKIDREIPFTAEKEALLVWFDSYSKSIYLLQRTLELDGIKGANTFTVDSVHKFNLTTKNWETLGVLSDSVSKMIQNYRSVINTKMGMLVVFGGEYHLINLNKNRIYKLHGQIASKIPITNTPKYAFWSIDNHVFFVNLENQKLDSIKIDSINLIPTSQTIYSDTIIKNDQYYYLLVLPLTILLLIALTYFLKKKINPFKKLIVSTEKKKDKNPFKSIEIALIKLIVENITHHNKFTSMDEVNYILGITSKTINMQKRTRSIIIKTINAKFYDISPNAEELIKRNNSEEDARYKEFYIDEIDLDIISKYL